jgi:hypothetical protein
MKALYRCAFALLLLATSEVAEAQFTPGNVVCRSTGHCYQVFALADGCYAWETINAFASTLYYPGKPGHLLTVESAAENNPNDGNGAPGQEGYLAATGPNGGPYTWVVGPSAGTTVVYFGTYVPPPTSGNCVAFGPHSRLKRNNGIYYATPASGGPHCTLSSCSSIGGNFVVEYEPDVVPPQVQLSPNLSGGAFAIGSTLPLSWNASDAFGTIVAVRIELSRSGPSGPFELIANLTDSGSAQGAGSSTNASTTLPQSYDWTVTGPAVASAQAYFRIAVTDIGGNQSTAMSTSGNCIGTCSTPARASSWGRAKAIYR